MIDLILCIICCALLVIALKLFDIKGVQSFPAITINYLTSTILGFLFLENKNLSTLVETDWLKYAFFLGCLFVSIFFTIGQTAKYFGASTASVSMKLGLIFPILFSAVLYHEPFSTLKVVGVLFAIAAVVLCSYKPTELHERKHPAHIFLLPLIAFVGSGACDSIVQFMQKTFVKQAETALFNFSLFLAACTVAVVILLAGLVQKKFTIGRKEIIGGIALGVPNYFSMYYLMSTLNNSGLHSSLVFPSVNIGTVLLTTLVSIMFFHETLNKLNWMGLALAVVGIAFLFIG